MRHFPSIFQRLFLVVTLQEIYLYRPLYSVLSNVAIPLHQHNLKVHGVSWCWLPQSDVLNNESLAQSVNTVLNLDSLNTADDLF